MNQTNNVSLSSSPIIHINEMQRMYANLLKKEYKEILGLHMTELMVLNYAHHVRNNDTYILRRDSHNKEVNGKIKLVSVFYISKTNLYSRPSNPASYRFANMAAYKWTDFPHVSTGFEQDDEYCVRILYEYNTVPI
jgi:hypothetical protein